jgi:L-alanine-DL-glutamate epimerase-like enolase superfamily enzyme
MRNVDVEMGGVYGSPLDYFVNDIVQTSTVAKDGAIRLSDAPGLGVSVDEEKISRYRRQ